MSGALLGSPDVDWGGPQFSPGSEFSRINNFPENRNDFPRIRMKVLTNINFHKGKLYGINHNTIVIFVLDTKSKSYGPLTYTLKWVQGAKKYTKPFPIKSMESLKL